jgi:hypothetical protein
MSRVNVKNRTLRAMREQRVSGARSRRRRSLARHALSEAWRPAAFLLAENTLAGVQ